ncbi:uncharacterized protein LOC114738876 [Neltuma alba]|uniref:uncharacterized protein LOC114738876 n=1 Tax=Neltuma alba TaxID=207710 RepID=UPI0010A3346E|nr:uncharacterized protein LOC114738876 [Prosopis alba]
MSARSSLKKMSQAKGQSSGWAAFDFKQRQKQGLESEVAQDPFPAIASIRNSLPQGEKLLRNNHALVKSFSSVLLPSNNFPAAKENGNNKTMFLSGDSGGNHRSAVPLKDATLAIKKLKEQHCWAENSLIEDVLATVSNDISKASTFLEAMVLQSTLKNILWLLQSILKIKMNQLFLDQLLWLIFHVIRQIKASLQKIQRTLLLLVLLILVITKTMTKTMKVEILPYNTGLLNSVPVEPEWEEDDVYLSHRMNALQVMRSASRHSKGATNAFLRGDHFSARQHSMKAQENLLTAQRLNAKAAKEIFSIRNSENDIWRLDLHGLHASEAIEALQEYLHRIESQGFLKGSNGVKDKDGVVDLTSGSVNSMDKRNLDKKQAPVRLRSSALEVITGIGNHSRGQAALPTAVRSFLNENGYRFEEMRPGVLAVWPKFRRS